MKYYLLLAGLLSLTACGSGSADTSSAPQTPGTATAAATSSDPRIAQIHALHEQLLTLQKSFVETEKQLVPLEAQVEKLKNSDMLQKDKDLTERKREFSELISTSQNIEASINQLDQSKSQDATQVQLVGESLERSKAVVERATDLVEKNNKWVKFFERTAAFRKGQKAN